jgi:deazaflavin-dependent oxidoreductase (nitroreductase family)
MSGAARAHKPEFLYLTTTGWKSGSPHEIEIWFVAQDGCYYLCAEHRERTHWVRNIQHQPSVTFWVHGQTYQGSGRTLDPQHAPDLIATVAAAFTAKYNWNDGLFVELCPNREN